MNVCVFSLLSMGCDIKHTENHLSRVSGDVLKNVEMAFHDVFHLPIQPPLPLSSACQALHPRPIKLVLGKIIE